MKIDPKQNIFFQKKLMATCAINDSNGQVPCSIYKIENKDEDYFSSLIHKPGWNDYIYALILDGDIRRKNADAIYVLEDNKNKCLGFMEAYTKDGSENCLEFIEVKPIYRAGKSKRRKKYIGETMLNFLAQLTKKEGKKVLSIPHVDSSAIRFYDKCYCSSDGNKRHYVMYAEDIDKLRQNNVKHTGNEINIVG